VKRKILTVVNNLWAPPVRLTGIASVYAIQKELARRGHEVHVLTMIGSWEQQRSYPRDYPVEEILRWMAKEQVDHGIEFHHFRLPGLEAFPVVRHVMSRIYPLWRVPALVRKYALDVVHEYSSTPALAWRTGAYSLLGARTVHTLIGEIGGGLYESVWARRGAAGLDCLVCTSKRIRDRMLGQAYPADRLAYVPLGIDVNRFAGDKNQRTARRKFGIPDGRTVFLFLAPLLSWKGYRQFIEAARELRSSGAFFVVATYESPDLMGHTAARRKVLDAFRGIPENSLYLEGELDIPELMAACDCVVLPLTRHDGATSHPVTALEAMASGRCVIATDVAGSRELLESGSGILIPPSDRAGLKEAILRVIAEPETAREMGRSGRTTARDRFDIRRTAESLERIYANA